MERSIQKNGLINFLALLAVGVASFASARYASSAAGLISSVFLGIGVLVAAVSWFQIRLVERERLEKMELDELARSKGGASLFEAKDAEVFPARRSREQFERFFVPGFAVILFLFQLGGAYLLWRSLSQVQSAVRSQPMVAMALFALFGLTLFIIGRFAAAFARIEDNRLLRPSAGYLLLGAYLSFVVALGIAAQQAGFKGVDFYVAKALCVLLGVVGIETLVTLVLELYRPRVKGKVTRPLYESRVVSLLGQPEGLLTTAAHTLDYQFGFKVSETWFFRFLEKAFLWLVLLQFGALMLSTCVVFIDAGEQALLERFGKPVAGREILSAGGHFKFPWPIDKVYRFPTEQVQSFEVGMAPDEKEEHGKFTLWSVSHGKEDNFLVASREQRGAQPVDEAGTNTVTGKRSPPVSLVTVSIPVQYQITNLVAWAYNNEDPNKLLEDIATRQVVKYLVSVDLQEIMTRDRLEASKQLREQIQAAAADRKLGAKITFVGLEDIHPPVAVAGEYEKVVAAIQTKEARILEAQSVSIRTNALADAQAFTILNTANAERQRREVSALAQTALFTNQIPAWRAAPGVYTERAYLQAFVRGVASARKYILLATNTEDVIQFDLQDKIRQDLLDLSVPPPKR